MAIAMIIGSRSTAEYFATKARPKTAELSHQTRARPSWRCHHQAPTAARKNNAMHESDVATAPRDRYVGQNTKKTRETRAPASPNNLRDQQKTSSPVAALKSAIIARPAIRCGK